MSNAFVPVDLDKLLDDFEEQDSISASVSSQKQTTGTNQGRTDGCSSTSDCGIARPEFATTKTFPFNGLPTNNTDTSTNNSKEDHNDLLSDTTTADIHTNEVNYSKLNVDLLSSDVTVRDSSLSANTKTLTNGEARHNIDHRQEDCCRRIPVTGNLLDLTDVDKEVSSISSTINKVDLLGDVGSLSVGTLRSPDITNGITDRSTSTQNDLLSDMSSSYVPRTESVHQDLLLLDIDGSVDNDSSLRDNEDSLIDLTTEDSRPEIAASFMSRIDDTVGFFTEDSKESFNHNVLDEDQKRNEFSTETRNADIPNQTSMGQVSAASNKWEAPTDIVGTSAVVGSGNIHSRTSELNQASDDNEHAVHLLAEEQESSLLFMQDHFGNSVVASDMTDNMNTCVNCENSSPGTNNAQSNSEVDSRQEAQAESIPVAQDAVTEVSDEPSPVVNNYELLEHPFQLGYSAPSWLPDSNVTRCMSCQCKFTVVKRRHHCRACGKIYCSTCCNLKFNLQYLEDKLARVCQACANILLQRQAALTNRNTSVSSNDEAAMYVYLNPEEPEAPVEQEPSNDVEEVVSEVEQPPEYEATEALNSNPVEVTSVVPVFTDDNVTGSSQFAQFRPTTCSSSSSLSSTDIPVTSTIPLPPLLKKTDEGLKIEESPNHQEILYLLKKRKETVSFLLNKNLVVRLKIVKLNCCVKRKCWCFSSEGMQAADQEDMVILLECIPKESSIPQDVLSHFNTAFAYARQGHRVTDLGYTIFGQPFLGSLRNAGFLYVKSSFQCLENLVLPSGPHIFGILIQREEVSWVQLFPIRLILRLGAEFRYYPCPLWSVRDREPLYGDIGHTIMNLLADFKNFQYTLPRVTGMHVHLENKKTVVQLPQNRYDEVLKVLNATDEYVMAFEATFSNVADSHLVCIQEGTGYKTQSINLEGQERKVTGASFIVFNGALKSTTDLKAKVSIVEDGVMVQMIKQLSEEMRQAMREMSDFTIYTGCPDSDSGAVQQVVFEWVSKRNPDVQSVLSPIDGLTLGMTSDIKINTHFDFSTPSIFRLRWTELFFLDRAGERPRNLPAQFKQTTADIAKACTVALRPYLYNLYQAEKRRIGLRVNLSTDMVGYIIGSQGSSLPDEMAINLDNELVPAIHNAVNPSSDTPTSMEFLFNIVEMLS